MDLATVLATVGGKAPGTVRVITGSDGKIRGKSADSVILDDIPAPIRWMYTTEGGWQIDDSLRD